MPKFPVEQNKRWSPRMTKFHVPIVKQLASWVIKIYKDDKECLKYEALEKSFQ